MTVNPKRDELVYVSATSGRLGLYRLDLKSGNPQRLSLSSNIQNPGQRDEWPQFSGDGKNLTWVHVGDAQNSEIWISTANGLNPHKLAGGDAVYWSPVWQPVSNEILFSSNRENKDIFEFYAVKADGSCLRKVSDNAKLKMAKKNGFKAWQMQFDANGTRVAFVSDISGQPEIYIWNAQVPPCAKVTASVDSK
jgi:Tol biopolymer transport system component